MKIKLCIVAMLLLCLGPWHDVQAQRLSVQRAAFSKYTGMHPIPLSINDSVPALNFRSIINAQYKNANLQQFNNKLVILDFMATTCRGCIEALPRLDSLQAKYKNKLQIFLVTYETPAVVSHFLKNNLLAKNTILPFITGDTVLSQWFPHSYISHEVWITPKQKVLAITECEYVSDENIKLALSGQPVHWPLKQDIALAGNDVTLIRFSDADSLHYQAPSTAYYTVFSSWLKTRQAGFVYQQDTAKNLQRFYISNYPITGMYLLAYDTIALTTGHIILNVPDKQHFVYTKGVDYLDDWDRNNRYCYESMMPLSLGEAAMRRKVRDDLDNFFGLQSQLALQETACWVLQDTAVVKNTDTAGSNGGPTYPITIGNLLYRLEHDEYGTPVINESSAGIEDTIQVTGKESVAELNEILIHHGLIISKLLRLTTILTIKKAP